MKRYSPRRILNRRPSHAFTLIELLTVIAIISVLAAILIPVVGGVKRSAQLTKCASNLRQISIATLAYVSDNNGRVPRPTIKAASDEGEELGITSDLQWSKQLGPYLPLRGSSLTSTQNIVFVCPSANYDGRTGDELSGTYHCSGAFRYYPRTASSSNTGSATKGPARLLSQFENPAKTIIVSEGKQAGRTACRSNVSWPEARTDIASATPEGTNHLDFRHSGSILLLYLDGHVEVVSFEESAASITQEKWEGRLF